MTKDFVRYENDADVHMRLAGTYLRYKGDAYYCDHSGGMEVTLYSIQRGGLAPFEKVNANDPELDISSVPLGYCNAGRGPVYLAREAARRQKQGVTLNSIAGFDENSRQWFRPIGKNIPINHDRVRDTIRGDYPTLDAIFKDGTKGAAFHRRLCLMPLEGGGRWKIKYMTNFVGILTEKGLKARLVNQHQGNSFLRNALELRGININVW